jgi:hypothetical protein
MKRASLSEDLLLHHLGNGRGARVELDAEQLVRVHGFAAQSIWR